MRYARLLTIAALGVLLVLLAGCDYFSQTADTRDMEAVQRQQTQYQISQPVPAFNRSLERHLVINLYHVRNQQAVTHSIWRSDLGTIEGDCPRTATAFPTIRVSRIRSSRRIGTTAEYGRAMARLRQSSNPNRTAFSHRRTRPRPG